MRKENYLTPNNAEEKIRSWFLALEGLRGRKKIKNLSIMPENAALLVIDMQKYFTQPDSHAFVFSSEVVIENINKIIESFNPEITLYTKHIDIENSPMLRWWEKGIFADNPLSEIDPRIKVRGIVVPKHTYSAFYGTELEHLLESHNIERVYITGLLTNLCCETTARDAFVRGYEVFFVGDATATYNEQLHFATLLNLCHGFTWIISTNELIGGK